MSTVLETAQELVKISRGKLRGSVADGVVSFKGIPYAAPPVGRNHLRPPEPVESWSGVREALNFGPKSPQVPYPSPFDVFIPELAGPGEDCLNLNIWTPELGAARLPVMVWIPGGMYEFHATGACPWYDGSHFARDGVVCVTINYRAGAEGFLYLDDGIANCGLLDQIAALNWVQENIAAFGGDPGNVTVFGESAGALSIGTLLAMPRAKSLFHRAILQSGASHHVSTAASAEKIGRELAAKLGVPPNRTAIAAEPVDRLLAAQSALREDLIAHPDPERWGAEIVTSMLPWQPTIDGETLPARPIDRIVAGVSANIALIVGTNTDEHRLFLASTGAMEHITSDLLANFIVAYGLPLKDALDCYRADNPEECAADMLAALQTDWYWRLPALRLADAHAMSANAPTYMYEFAWKSPQFNGQVGACHALEIPFVFDTLGNKTETLWGDKPPQELADNMHKAWVAFATNGDCGWPRYDLSRRATMRFDVKPHVVEDPRAAERSLWEGVR